jgi:hypothetical protein
MILYGAATNGSHARISLGKSSNVQIRSHMLTTNRNIATPPATGVTATYRPLVRVVLIRNVNDLRAISALDLS